MVFGGQSVIKGWEIFEAKDKINSTELFYHMADCIRRGAKEVFGEAKGRGGHDKETWWWNADDKAILDRWNDYFWNLLNGTHVGELNLEEFDSQEGRHRVFHCRVSAKEVGKALKRMKLGKAVGPDDIPIEAWKCLGGVEIQWLTRLFNRILETRKMLDVWRHSILVPIYKNKGDI
ncbi:hypothetical protein UlMin_023753 [Ulmus minor]